MGMDISNQVIIYYFVLLFNLQPKIRMVAGMQRLNATVTSSAAEI